MAKHINKVELQGIVGSVRFFPVAGQDSPRLVRFSLATNYCYNTNDGTAVIDTTWHSLSVLESRTNALSWLERGKTVYVEGRIRNVRFVDDYGHDRTITEVVVEDMYQVNS